MGCDAIATQRTKMGRDKSRQTERRWGAMQSQHKGRSIKATKPLSTRSNGKTVANEKDSAKNDGERHAYGAASALCCRHKERGLHAN
jgi:hypothetical protein